MKNKILQTILGFSTPVLSTIVLLLLDLNFIFLPKDKIEILDLKIIHAWKTIGALIPAFWLTAIGGDGLLKDGGFLIRIFRIFGLKITPSINNIFNFACLWLLIATILAFLLQILVLDESVFNLKILYRSLCYLLYGLHSCCLSSGLGVFALLSSIRLTT